MGTIKNLTLKGKDLAVSKALKTLGERYVSQFGKIMSLKLDSKKKEIDIELLLKGDSDPIEVHIKGYEIISEGNKRFIRAGDIDISKEWMKVLVQDHIIGRKFRVPDSYSKVLETLV
jgi:hypothetical protein